MGVLGSVTHRLTLIIHLILYTHTQANEFTFLNWGKIIYSMGVLRGLNKMTQVESMAHNRYSINVTCYHDGRGQVMMAKCCKK